MKYKILTYTIPSATTIQLSDTTITAANLCSILNETTVGTAGVSASILYSSIDKSKLVSVVNGLITLQNVSLNSTDSLAIQVDDGLATPSGYALQGANANATNTAIYSAVSSIPNLPNLYAARVEANSDGTDTYTIVFPYTAQVEESESDGDITITV